MLTIHNSFLKRGFSFGFNCLPYNIIGSTNHMGKSFLWIRDHFQLTMVINDGIIIAHVGHKKMQYLFFSRKMYKFIILNPFCGVWYNVLSWISDHLWYISEMRLRLTIQCLAMTYNRSYNILIRDKTIWIAVRNGWRFTGGKLILCFNGTKTFYLKRRSNLLPLGSIEYLHTLKKTSLRHIHFSRLKILFLLFAFFTAANIVCKMYTWK